MLLRAFPSWGDELDYCLIEMGEIISKRFRWALKSVEKDGDDHLYVLVY